MKRILVYSPPEDEAQLALGEAAGLARVHGASLRVLRVLDAARWLGGGHAEPRRTERVRVFLEASQRETLAASVAPLASEGLEVEAEVRWGTPWLELVRAVLRDRHDLVVKAAEGAAQHGGLFFGSTALHLIRKCPCPVWVVAAPGAARPRRVLAAIDPEVGDATRFGLALRVLVEAARFATAPGAELHAAAVWQAHAERLLEPRIEAEDLGAWLLALETEARSGLEKAVAELTPPLPASRIHLWKGDPRRVLPERIESEAYDLLVLGSLGRVGISGLLIGDTAEALIRSVRCSVLAVKPPGFLCPVRSEGA